LEGLLRFWINTNLYPRAIQLVNKNDIAITILSGF
jgi:hypothetical protein